MNSAHSLFAPDCILAEFARSAARTPVGLRHALRSKGRLCQADSFNVFNRVRFAGPNLNITNVNFGRITAVANSPRAVQFNARISF